MAARRTIRVGVVGVGRGQSFMPSQGELADAVGMELVAICDIWEERLEGVAGTRGVAAYAEYDKSLEQEMDAVVLANFYHQHAPFRRQGPGGVLSRHERDGMRHDHRRGVRPLPDEWKEMSTCAWS